MPATLPDRLAAPAAADATTLDQGFAAPSGRRSGAGTAALAVSEAQRSERLARMRAGELGSVHSWELVTAVDGPGTRMTVFLAGCPLRCLYCHNPDTWQMRAGEPIEAQEILARLRRYRKVFAATGGGLTLSGGEVLMQPAFAARLLAGAKAMGVHTCLDTSGYLGAACTDEMLDDVDLVLLDIKAGDEQTHRRVTGRPLAPTLAFGQRLAAAGIRVWVRFVLVPGVTDDPDNIRKVAEHAAAIGTLERVEVLPFHQMGRDKWDALGLDYALTDVAPPTDEQWSAACEQFRRLGLPVGGNPAGVSR
ncbi:pyruvate formate-lyase-activating protein [Pseudactinotalea terrae]|uniref:pyruvate formate-lyase-activating protein n=1 Tax=Pseudactinotalea terrae TaxID=1743262 RepID=UPI0012E11A2E|nr:pyruvate formate-lyase-activating protein [Pseudactinotalea terrae]